jgi:hypothetical protein
MSIVLDGSNLTTTGVINSGTTQVSTSGTSIDFSSIPSATKRVTVMFSGVSTNGTNAILIQLASAGSVETTGYISLCGYSGGTNSAGGASSTAGFIVFSTQATNVFYGNYTLTYMGSNLWTGSTSMGLSAGGVQYSVQGGGNKTLASTIDRVRITTVGGTDAFDAGSINILYE